MKRFLLIILCCFIVTNLSAQYNNTDFEHNLSFGVGGIMNPYLSVQLEHVFNNSRFSFGEHLKTFYGTGTSFFIVGPQIEVFTRLYLNEKRKKNGNLWFLNFKSGYGRMSLPYGQSNTDNLFDINGVLVLDSDNEPIKIYNNNLNRFGFGIALGYKTCSCKDWLVDILFGYQYWSYPQYFTEEYTTWKNDNCCNYTNFKESDWDYGFPIDIQIKLGKKINW